MGAGILTASYAPTAPLTEAEEAFLARLDTARLTHPGNRCARYLNRDLFLSLTIAQREMLHRCCRSGAENLDSAIGCYILHPGNLRELQPFFLPLLRDYHQLSATDRLVSGWDAKEGREGGGLDLATLGLPPVSMRVRVARNLEGFNLPGSMTRAERIRFEKAMVQSLRALIERPEYGGRVYSLTPEFAANEPNPNLITRREHQQLVDAHIMFKDMTADRYLASAGLAADWPYGRACYVSADRGVIVWLGEEDHLRIMCMQTGTRLDEVVDRLREILAVVESLPGITFAHDEQFGYITSCPSNLGTGLRPSVHVALPHLTRNGGDVTAACERLGLSVCGVTGDHTPIAADGILALSPTRRLFISERDIVKTLFEGIRKLPDH